MLLTPCVYYSMRENVLLDFCQIVSSGEDDNKTNHVDIKFDRIDLVCLVVSSVFGLWYLVKKHWIANNIFGLAFSLTGIEVLHLNRSVLNRLKSLEVASDACEPSCRINDLGGCKVPEILGCVILF